MGALFTANIDALEIYMCWQHIDILPTIIHKNLVYILGSDVKQT